MIGDGEKFISATDKRAAKMADDCTRCGRCVTVCPMTSSGEDAQALIGGVLDLIKSDGEHGSHAWIDSCTSSGFCIRSCPEKLNPRFMIVAARMMVARRKTGEQAARKTGAINYRNMSRGVRVISRLQLKPDELARLGQAPKISDDQPKNTDFVFYIGCNVLKTPHIALLCLDVLDALGMTYRVMGGPSTCCGVQQLRSGDKGGTGKLSFNTIRTLSSGGTKEVLSWCPGCDNLLDDVALPSYRKATGEDTFGMSMFINFLDDRLDDLRKLMIHPVNKRVGLHEHAGAKNVSEAAKRILRAIPGLEFVHLPLVQMASTCTDYLDKPMVQKKAHTDMLEAAKKAEVTALAGVYHACHRDLCSHEKDWPFEMVNMMELIGESIGITRPDLFKRFKIMADVDAIMAESAEMIEIHNLDPAIVREEVSNVILGG